MLGDGTGAETKEEANKFDGNRHQENEQRRRTDSDGHVGIRKGHTKERKIEKIESALSGKMERGTRVGRKMRKLGDHRTIH